MTTYAVLIHTRHLENYGEPTSPWWKPKGGSTTWMCNYETDTGIDKTALMNGLSEVIARHEIRDSPMFIEMMDDISVITLAEAEERSSIDIHDPAIESDEYFRHIRKADSIVTYIK